MQAEPYLPLRLKSASITDDLFYITTSNGEDKINLSSIRFICLGVIEEIDRGSETQPSGLRSMVRKLLGSHDDESNQKIKTVKKKRSYYLDFFVKEKEQPYRIESTSMNYKGLSVAAPVPVEWEQEQWHTAELCTKKGSNIPEVKVNREVTSDFKYPTSLDNFKNLVNLILDKAPGAFMNDSCRIFKEKKRIDEKIYGTVYEFQRESMELFKKIVSASPEDKTSNG